MNTLLKTPENTYQARNENVISEEFDGEMVVLDLESGLYFGLNATAARLWPHIVGGCALAPLYSAVQGFEDFMNGLVKFNLIIPSGIAHGQDVPMDLGGASEPPLMEVFEDLSDLFKADPIHDVDIDMGWPHTRPKE